MPLSSGKSKKALAGNIKELMHAYKASGKIGNTTPKNKAHAARIAAAIAYRKKRGE